jgi:hypothetical protein
MIRVSDKLKILVDNTYCTSLIRGDIVEVVAVSTNILTVVGDRDSLEWILIKTGLGTEFIKHSIALDLNSFKKPETLAAKHEEFRGSHTLGYDPDVDNFWDYKEQQ